ncbi:MAG TPA: pentapeptide repeat-containing protein [Patescibacteria group bacterium]|nr:pentapeptide repeat-containing protein [Patescibacteria group bacterium]
MNNPELSSPADEIVIKTNELAKLVREKYGIRLAEERRPVFDENAYSIYQELRKLGKGGTREEKIEWAYKKAALGYINLDLAEFDGLDLSHVDLTGINLAGASFRGCNLEWTNFSGTKCMLADFQESNLHLANMVGALAINTNFQRSQITGARFRESFFNYADFSGARIEQTDMSFCIFYGSSFNGTLIDQTRFEYSVYHTEALKEAEIKSGVFLLDDKQYSALAKAGLNP